MVPLGSLGVGSVVAYVQVGRAGGDGRFQDGAAGLALERTRSMDDQIRSGQGSAYLVLLINVALNEGGVSGG